MTSTRSYAEQDVLLIDFPSKRSATLGNMTVYADARSFEIIGYGFRD